MLLPPAPWDVLRPLVLLLFSASICMAAQMCVCVCVCVCVYIFFMGRHRLNAFAEFLCWQRCENELGANNLKDIKYTQTHQTHLHLHIYSALATYPLKYNACKKELETLEKFVERHLLKKDDRNDKYGLQSHARPLWDKIRPEDKAKWQVFKLKISKHKIHTRFQNKTLVDYPPTASGSCH